jgi:DNA-binding transcriptional MerR regulator
VEGEQRSEWAISEVAAMTGTTSRTLRHYGDIGLLPPSRVGRNGYRYYDLAALMRLQRILLLRELGLRLTALGEVLAREVEVHTALEAHLRLLRAEQRRIQRQLASVQRTLDAMKEGKEPDVTEIFDGFDHTEYKDEVEQRWGAHAYARGASWWQSKTRAEQQEFQREQAARARAWLELAQADASPTSPEAQRLAARHVSWLRGIPGTPAESGDDDVLRRYVLGLADLYAADDRFAANYGGAEGAAFVRAALRHYVGEVTG